MWRKPVEAILNAVSLDSKAEWRIAYCRLHIELDYELAKELSPRVAATLFELNPRPIRNHAVEYLPILSVGYVKFDTRELDLGPEMKMEFQALPDQRIPGAALPGVEIRYVEAVRQRGAAGHTLVMGIRFRFLREQSTLVGKLVMEQLHSSVWLTFNPQQARLPLDIAEPDAAFINARAARK